PQPPCARGRPLAGTAVDWPAAHQGDIRFPWLGLGTSLAGAPVLAQWADLAGARGVTLWLVWCNVMLVEALIDGRGAWGRGGVGRIGTALATVRLPLGSGTRRMPTRPRRDA